MSTAATLLSPAFYNRDPRKVARALLGKVLVRKTPRGPLAGRIVETEAYLGQGDAAAHTAAGKTARNAVLFGPPGFAYVYFIYGNYFCLNVSCLPDGDPGGVLFRALEPIAGIGQMARARGLEWSRTTSAVQAGRTGSKGSAVVHARGNPALVRAKEADLRRISSGPGRLSEAFGISRARDNGKNLTSPRSDLQIVDDGYRVEKVIVGPRIGITKSADHPLRYRIAGNAFVSL